MELTERKRKILAAIVRNYISSGEPVGSKALCEMLDIGLSSATLRNEMSDLCFMGFLEQPHTSAGRIPTCLGYRYYVSDLMTTEKPTPEIRLAIDSTLESIARTPEQMPALSCQILADLTGLPAFCATLSNDSAKVKRVRMIPMGKKTMLIIVVSTDGVAKSRIVLSDYDLTETLLSLFNNICKVLIVGHSLSELNTAYLQSIVARVGSEGLGVLPMLSAIFEIISEMFSPSLHFRGETKLISGYNNQPDAARIGELISQKDKVISLISDIRGPVDVIFSDEYSHEADAPPSSIVVAKFSTGNLALGRIGIIGRARMAYDQLFPSLEYFAERLGILMTKAMRDMED